MESDLWALIDPVTQKPAIKAVRRTASLYGGDAPEKLPDLFAEWADASHFVERVLHPRTELRQAPCEFHRGTDHTQFGFLAAAVSGRGDLGVVSPLDLVPTIVTHLGGPFPQDLPGRTIPHMSAHGRSNLKNLMKMFASRVHDLLNRLRIRDRWDAASRSLAHSCERHVSCFDAAFRQQLDAFVARAPQSARPIDYL